MPLLPGSTFLQSRFLSPWYLSNYGIMYHNTQEPTVIIFYSIKMCTIWHWWGVNNYWWINHEEIKFLRKEKEFVIFPFKGFPAFLKSWFRIDFSLYSALFLSSDNKLCDCDFFFKKKFLQYTEWILLLEQLLRSLDVMVISN